MASVADKKRAKKAKTISLARTAAPESARRTIIPAKGAYVSRQTGLEWLRNKGKISPREFVAGERYGSLERTAAMEGTALLKSCLDTDGVRGAGTPIAPGADAMGAAEYITQARADLARARAALSFHAGMIAALDLICGRGMTSREISDVQREAEEIDNGLRIGLQILVQHWAIR
jgi:hypothetical protein